MLCTVAALQSFFPVNSYLESSFLTAQAWRNKQLSKVPFWLVLNSSITNTRHQTASVDTFVFPWGGVFVAHMQGRVFPWEFTRTDWSIHGVKLSPLQHFYLQNNRKKQYPPCVPGGIRDRVIFLTVGHYLSGTSSLTRCKYYLYCYSGLGALLWPVLYCFKNQWSNSFREVVGDPFLVAACFRLGR